MFQTRKMNVKYSSWNVFRKKMSTLCVRSATQSFVLLDWHSELNWQCGLNPQLEPPNSFIDGLLRVVGHYTALCDLSLFLMHTAIKNTQIISKRPGCKYWYLEKLKTCLFVLIHWYRAISYKSKIWLPLLEFYHCRSWMG